jgi:hypothetical protein
LFRLAKFLLEGLAEIKLLSKKVILMIYSWVNKENDLSILFW